MDEEEKRLAKIKAHRDTHVKRSAIPTPQPARVASMDAAAGPETPAGESPAAAAVPDEPPASASAAGEPAGAEADTPVEATA